MLFQDVCEKIERSCDDLYIGLTKLTQLLLLRNMWCVLSIRCLRAPSDKIMQIFMHSLYEFKLLDHWCSSTSIFYWVQLKLFTIKYRICDNTSKKRTFYMLEGRHRFFVWINRPCYRWSSRQPIFRWAQPSLFFFFAHKLWQEVAMDKSVNSILVDVNLAHGEFIKQWRMKSSIVYDVDAFLEQSSITSIPQTSKSLDCDLFDLLLSNWNR
jgi:hypothetical protein